MAATYRKLPNYESEVDSHGIPLGGMSTVAGVTENLTGGGGPSNNNNSNSNSWEFLRKEARSLEQQIDSRLISFSQSSQFQAPSSTNSMDNGGGPNDLSNNSNNAALSNSMTTQQELTVLLTSLERITSQMQEWTLRNPSAYSHLHSRHLANLYEYNREFNKTRANIQQQRDHLELLSGGGGGIYSRNSTSGGGGGSSFANQHSRMENSHNAVDEILQRAIDSQNDLERQQSDLRSFQSRIKRVMVRFPLVRNVLSQIQQKKNRDSLILGSLIGVCCLILLWMMFGR